MSNALVNRIRQRLEARRDFMRSVFSKHHALTWRMTDAPSLRLLGLTPKKTEPNRPRAVQAPRDAKVQPGNARAIKNPDLASQAFETERSFEVTEPTLETMVTDSSFVVSNALSVEPQADSSLEAQDSTVESSPELEDSATFEPTVQASPKLDLGRAKEILERRESSATPELQAGVALSVRSGETTPPDVSPRASIPNIVPDGVVTPRVELSEVASSEVLSPQETRASEQSQVAAELPKLNETQTVQNTNNSMIESQSSTPEKIENPQSSQNKPLTPARASEILQQRAAQVSQPSNSSISKPPNETQKTAAESKNQLEPAILRETENQTTPALESNESASSEQQTELSSEPALVARDTAQTPDASAEILTSAEVPTSRFEPTAEQSTPQSTPKMETREAALEETRVSQNQGSDSAPRETTSEIAQIETQAVIQPSQEFVAREIPQESSTREIQLEPVALESQQEFAAREIAQEPVTRDAPQEPITSDTRTEPQSESISAQPSPEQSDWQRSIPGDPQSGVVEIIRAKPPRNLRPERLEKPSEPREETAKPQSPEARVLPTPENVVQPKQNLSERMKSLQQRFGGTEQTRFDQSTKAFSQRVEGDATEQTPAPKFQSISDVAQRLARRYAQAPTTTSSEEENSSLDLKVGQQLNQTQTRAASGFVQQGTQPVQLRESTRTFLAPLIGFDPSLARVFVNPQASEFTSSLNADGATVGTDVYLNNGFDEQAAEGLGLLAHELTHVGQNLQPDFVPPMLQNVTDQQDFRGESFETQARAVEARVTNTASMFVPGIALEAANARQTSTAPTAPSNATRNTDPWNGLPAPWEAMPKLSTNPSDFVTVIAPSSVGSSGSTTSTGFAPVADAPSAGVQLAESDRPSDNPDNQPPGAAGGQPHPPAQDMDLLAQQVYDILKRRLSSERRREG